jgi:hypothetical protein
LHLNQSSGNLIFWSTNGMVIKGEKHLAEVAKMQDPLSRKQRYRYTLQREGSSHVIYWGHEPSEEAALQMANMYLTVLDEAVSLKHSDGSKPKRVQYITVPVPMRA